MALQRDESHPAGPKELKLLELRHILSTQHRAHSMHHKILECSKLQHVWRARKMHHTFHTASSHILEQGAYSSDWKSGLGEDVNVIWHYCAQHEVAFTTAMHY